MKKYLLLASVAGCLLASNAIAGSIVDNQQSAILNASVTISESSWIEMVQDINFGTLYMSKYQVANSDRALAILSTAGVVTPADTGLVSKTTTGTAGEITLSGGGFNEGPGTATGVVVHCSDGTGSPTAGDKCDISDDLAIGNVTVVTAASGASIGGTLYLKANQTAHTVNDAAALKVTLQY